ncbi:MAG: glycosyltransferase family 4 protein [Nitrospirota bacterium]|nr:glycosyltransferase family 4 protein [Nitrospirota bacterium]
MADPARPVKDRLTIVQLLPELNVGGVEQGVVDSSREYVQRGHRSIVISNGGRRVPEIEGDGGEHITLPIHKKSLLNAFRMVPRLAAVLRDVDADVVHARSRVPAWIGFFAARRAGVPFVTTVHGCYTHPWYSQVMVKGERVIAISQMVADYAVRSLGADRRRLRLVYRGLSRERYPYGFKPDPQWLEAWYRDYPDTRGRFVVTLPARLTRWKGQLDFLTVMEHLIRAGVPAVGLIVGGPHPRRTAFRDEVAGEIVRRGLDKQVFMTGNRTDVREIMAISNVVLSLSTDPEAFGRTNVEAASLGIPVAGYGHGGVGETLAHLLPEGSVPLGDTQGIADRLVEWSRTPPVVAREHPFTLENMVEHTLAVYREVVRG